MRIRVGKSFNRELKKLPPNRQDAVLKALVKFQTTLNLPSLASAHWRARTVTSSSIRIAANRIILRKTAEDFYAAVYVGPHDNVYRRWSR